MQHIWAILQETQGFDPLHFLPTIPKLLTNPETHRMGQQIAGGLAQRAVARLIREFLLRNEPMPEPPQNGRHNGREAGREVLRSRQLSLPASK